MDPFRFVDLFAGVGGFHHALAELGGECVLSIENDAECQRVYRQAFPDTPVLGDVREITQLSTGEDAGGEHIRALVPEHDVLCAGFPCQPFSKSGSQEGLRDKARGTLFFDIMEIIRAREPRFVILENVPNLVGPRHRATTWNLIIKSLRDAGYRVSSTPVIQSPHRLPPPFGAPQIRDRVFILAYRDPESAPYDHPPIIDRPKTPDLPKWDLDQFLDDNVDAKYRMRSDEETWLHAWDWLVRELPEDDLPGFPIWVDAWTGDTIPAGTPPWKRDFLTKNRAFYLEHQSLIDHWLAIKWDHKGTKVGDFPPSRRKFEWQARLAHPTRSSRTLWNLLVHFRPSGIRVKPATYAPALVAINQASVVALRRRRLTPPEAARLQGIPIDPFAAAEMTDASIYRQLGNAVNTGVVKYVAANLFKAADTGDQTNDHVELDLALTA